MHINGKVLDILYRQVTPERIYEMLIQDMGLEETTFYQDDIFSEKKQEKIFLDYAESTLYGYTEDEHFLLFRDLMQQKGHWQKEQFRISEFLIPLIACAEDHLIIKRKTPYCKLENLLTWRDNYLKLGQDLFICAYLAYLDCKNHTTRTNFTWPAIIRADYENLYDMLAEKGIAENHNHINGGTQSFQITWARLMNYPETIRTELRDDHFTGTYLNPKMDRGYLGKRMDFRTQLELAASIRSILFRALHRDEFYSTETYEENATRVNDAQTASSSKKIPFNGKKTFFTEYKNAFCPENVVADVVDRLRAGYGIKIATPRGDFCLDYTLDHTFWQEGANSDVRVLAGERIFLYKCMRACMDDQIFNSFEQRMFYLYLVLQSNFRSEMVQANDQTGFKNFANYQDRKDDAWEKNPYFYEAVRLGINNRLNSENIVALDARLAPKPIAAKNIEKAELFDIGERFGRLPTASVVDPAKYTFDKELDLQQFAETPFFFTYHFPKSRDKRQLKKGQFWGNEYRHEKHRGVQIGNARGLADALRTSGYMRARLRAIDAAADEFDCRPEIFAVPFRTITEVQKKWNITNNSFLQSSPMSISKTYHAGEDFQDIADGVRAIDEAIEYLEMGIGSRIGHALALGVDPKDHYMTKHFEIVTTKQDRLDDLVWILFRSKELGVVINPVLEEKLQAEANELLREIYGKTINEKKWFCTLEKYRCSMHLRCDHPTVYESGSYQKPGMSADEITEYYVNANNTALDHFREDECISGLIHAYQYGVQEAIVGKEIWKYEVKPAYMAMMKEIQDAMMRFIHDRKIIIECNPSSNVLIGTFKKYEKHPIFRFNNRKLVPYHEASDVQLHVCVNTDDLGVFDTSLEFEYALLYQTLMDQTDENFKTIYNDRDVMDYLRDLRDMGLEATFKSNTGFRNRNI